MARRPHDTRLPPPFLKRIWLPEAEDGAVDWPDWVDPDSYPFTIPFARDGLDIGFERAVTIIVGENGSGKSTLLEAIATMAGFNEGGGAQGMAAVGNGHASGIDGGALGRTLKSAWLPQVGRGWFFRAETFFSVARYLDEAGSPHADFLSASHGEGFLDFFEERLRQQGLFIFDEPEAALSPQKQFEFLKILRRMQRDANCQVIMATHSPILMALPEADLWAIDPFAIQPTTLEETAHYRLYREFVLYPHETVEAMIE
ncbi:MAG: AAA family ATPase [Sphingopyxis sp.]|uniref:AAA family ATPase n=1 Tax=Sphingopyxis sp. TaxID=1908224 RepID=UPI001A2D7825|nr:AAA family ATPase [Sphingopyxis sp.]MBJ7499986.1 AAA family ATPase [Sphingopyxis sp.]